MDGLEGFVLDKTLSQERIWTPNLPASSQFNKTAKKNVQVV